MKKLTQTDIQHMINKAQTRLVLEKLTAMVGDEFVLSRGLKIKNIESKLEYTIDKVRNVDGLWHLELVRYDENGQPVSLSITQDDFDNYERA
jgi:hypothetical protein